MLIPHHRLILGFCLHAVGTRIERSISHSNSRDVFRKVADCFHDGLLALVAHLVDIGHGRGKAQAMGEDTMADIGFALGLRQHHMMCVREYNRCPEGGNSVRAFFFCFRADGFVEGWLRQWRQM